METNTATMADPGALVFRTVRLDGLERWGYAEVPEHVWEQFLSAAFGSCWWEPARPLWDYLNLDGLIVEQDDARSLERALRQVFAKVIADAGEELVAILLDDPPHENGLWYDLAHLRNLIDLCHGPGFAISFRPDPV